MLIEEGAFMYCENCKYWDNGKEPNGRDKAQFGKNWGICTMTCTSMADALESSSKSLALDQEGYHAWLETHKNFGCLQYLVKPQ